MERILKISDEICSFIRNRIPNRYGLFRTEQFNGKLEWVSNRCDPDDFGDFAPFMLWFDRVAGKSSNTRWLERQLGLLNSLLRQKSGFYYPFSDGRRRVKQSNIFPVYPQSHLDLILGVNIMYRLTKDRAYLEINRGLCDGIIRYAISRRGFVHGAVIPGLHLHFPRLGYLRYKPQVSGVFIEELTNFYEISRKDAYLEAAKRMAKAWLNTKTFMRHGLFADQVYPLTNREVSTARISKENTNMIYGLIRLYEISGEEWVKGGILKCLKALELYRDAQKVYQKVFDTKLDRIVDGNVSITHNHMVLGALIDAYLVLKDRKYLKSAEESADFWIRTQSKNGLFLGCEKGQEKWNYCNIDSHSDFIVILSRLYGLTKRERYMRSIKKAAYALGLFKSGEVFYKIADYETGNILCRTNELKFLGGALKGLLSAYTVLNNVKKIDKETLRLLVRDR